METCLSTPSSSYHFYWSFWLICSRSYSPVKEQDQFRDAGIIKPSGAEGDVGK